MHEVETVAALLAVIGVVGVISQRVPVAFPILLVIAGMIISFVPQIPQVKLDPNIVFFIFLPPLLYLDAIKTNWKELREVADLVILQAFGLVLVTVVTVAAAIHAVVPEMPWAVAFVLGAIVSPTDVIAASALSKEVILPKRLMNVIKGESLVNDATGLVAYQIAVAATVTGAFSISEASLRFLQLGLGGVLLGGILGLALAKIRTHLDHGPVEIIVSLVTPFIVYLLAEHLHISGVLAVVTAGLILGWRGPTILSSETRLQVNANWDTFAFILKGLSFLLMGMQLRQIVETIKVHHISQIVLWAVVAALAPIVIRFLWTFGVGFLYSKLRQQPVPTWQQLFIASWAGMRGVVSLAAALALPLTAANGQPFPFREMLIFLTIVVIATTLLVQGVTLPFFLKKFDIEEPEEDIEANELKARLILYKEAVRAIDATARKNSIDSDDPAFEKLLHYYLERAVAISNDEVVDVHTTENWHLLKSAALESQRRVLVSLRKNDKIVESVFLSLQKELDLEEVHAQHVSTDPKESNTSAETNIS